VHRMSAEADDVGSVAGTVADGPTESTPPIEIPRKASGQFAKGSPGGRMVPKERRRGPSPSFVRQLALEGYAKRLPKLFKIADGTATRQRDRLRVDGTLVVINERPSFRDSLMALREIRQIALPSLVAITNPEGEEIPQQEPATRDELQAIVAHLRGLNGEAET
jgi:hypothetical protein